MPPGIPVLSIKGGISGSAWSRWTKILQQLRGFPVPCLSPVARPAAPAAAALVASKACAPSAFQAAAVDILAFLLRCGFTKPSH